MDAGVGGRAHGPQVSRSRPPAGASGRRPPVLFEVLTATEPTGLRERKRRVTRERLGEAALTLFERQGYDATRVEQVAAAAGVSTRTAFRYFPMKADLVFADSRRDGERMVAALRAAASERGASFATLRTALQSFVRELDQPRVARRATVVLGNEVLRRQALIVSSDWTAELAREIAVLRGLDEPDARSLLMAEAGLAALSIAVAAWALSGGGADLEAGLARAFDELERLGGDS